MRPTGSRKDPFPAARGQKRPEWCDDEHVAKLTVAGHAAEPVKEAVGREDRQRQEDDDEFAGAMVRDLPESQAEVLPGADQHGGEDQWADDRGQSEDEMK